MMMRWLGYLVVVSCVLLSGAQAGGKKPGKGFYKILVKPNAKWVMKKDTTMADQKKWKVVVETYDVRKVGEADVARMRWTHTDGTADGTSDLENDGLPTQVAVTEKGLYLLTKDMDDAKITATLAAKKPSRSDPPKAYKGTTVNLGRYLDIRKNLVCFGSGPTPGAGECDDVCYGEFCIDGTEGIVSIEGTYAPNYEDYKK
jgi:hypothetical protein